MKQIIEKIKSLPPLSKTVIDVISFSKKEDKTNEELILLIKDDPLIVASLLKIANSALFGFKNKIESIDNLVNLLGINFAISLILSNSIEKSMEIDFSLYGINKEEFRELTYTSVNFLDLWLSKIDVTLKNNLLLPIILIDLGKYILSSRITDSELKKEFLIKLENELSCLMSLEKEYCSISSIEATTLLLNFWNIDNHIVEHIKYIETIEDSPIKYKESSKILDVVKTICSINKPLSKVSIEKGLKKAKEYEFDIQLLNETIEKIQKRIKKNDIS